MTEPSQAARYGTQVVMWVPRTCFVNAGGTWLAVKIPFTTPEDLETMK